MTCRLLGREMECSAQVSSFVMLWDKNPCERSDLLHVYVYVVYNENVLGIEKHIMLPGRT